MLLPDLSYAPSPVTSSQLRHVSFRNSNGNEKTLPAAKVRTYVRKMTSLTVVRELSRKEKDRFPRGHYLRPIITITMNETKILLGRALTTMTFAPSIGRYRD